MVAETRTRIKSEQPHNFNKDCMVKHSSQLKNFANFLKEIFWTCYFFHVKIYLGKRVFMKSFDSKTFVQKLITDLQKGYFSCDLELTLWKQNLKSSQHKSENNTFCSAVKQNIDLSWISVEALTSMFLI